jgi:hypothetical protein
LPFDFKNLGQKGYILGGFIEKIVFFPFAETNAFPTFLTL